MLISADKLSAPTFSSTLIIGSSGTGKTSCIGTLHRVLRKKNLPTKIIYFDFDQDGAEPVLRLARAGYESIPDMIARQNRIDPWIEDVILYRYYTKRRTMTDGVAPHRDVKLVEEFIKDFNTIDSRIDPHTNNWKPGQEIGAIINDPLTSVQEIYEDFIWTLRNKELGASGTNSIQWVDWNLLGEKVLDVIKLTKVFPCFYVATAHLDQRLEDVRVPEGQQKLTTGKWFYTAALVKALAMTIQKNFSTTLFTTEQYKWRLQNDEHHRGARARGKDNLPPLVEPDFANILDV